MAKRFSTTRYPSGSRSMHRRSSAASIQLNQAIHGYRAVQHICLAQVSQCGIDENTAHPSFKRAFRTEIPDFTVHRDKTVVHQVAGHMVVLHIAHAYAQHLGGICFIELLLGDAVMLTTTFYQLSFGHCTRRINTDLSYQIDGFDSSFVASIT